MERDCPRSTRSIPGVFHHGGSRPEVVFRSGCRCARRVFSTDYGYFRQAESSTVSFQGGGREPEVVSLSGFRCCGRHFSIDPDCPRLAQSVLVV